ncbi:non-specific serine/threonine protein kinase [Malassezia yamatoensis]|uniref:Non-specific serine/threonine protein kinase n=1 Tax=Malassezia yamatoensis TaxID=253288 RepID=A0AAJ5YN22_9BASI|nr:non-specific serine/threonine protein kinase [Malassezia yamatoensis]
MQRPVRSAGQHDRLWPRAAANEARRGAKRKRQPVYNRFDDAKAYAVKVDDRSSQNQDTLWETIPVSGESSAKAQQITDTSANPVPEPSTSFGARTSKGMGLWASFGHRPMAQSATQATPLRTWRQRNRMQVHTRNSEQHTPANGKQKEISCEVQHPSPVPKWPVKRTAFLRSPHSNRLRRHSSPVKPKMHRPAGCLPSVHRRAHYPKISPAFRQVGFAPAIQNSDERPETDTFSWDDASDMDSSSLSDVESDSSLSSASASSSPTPLPNSTSCSTHNAALTASLEPQRSLSLSQSLLTDYMSLMRPKPATCSSPTSLNDSHRRSSSIPIPVHTTTSPTPAMTGSDPNSISEQRNLDAEQDVRSHATLQRRRRASLLDMCKARNLVVPAESTKQTLIQTLVAAGTLDSGNDTATQASPTAVHAQPAASKAPCPAPDPRPESVVPENEEAAHQVDLEQLELTEHEIPPEKLEKMEKIGSGAFKDVYLGKYYVTRKRIVDVAISDLRNELTEMDIKELQFLRDLRHDNIVRFIGVSVPAVPRTVPIMIVSELCSHGDMFDYIRNTPAPCDADLFQLLLEIARGLEYLHTRTPMVIHRDCKSTNVLITKDRVAKISDFGFARVKRSNRVMVRSIVGTVNWQAPELWVPKPNYNEKVDVWSAAMTFWEALQWHNPEKRYPFQGLNEHQIYHNVGKKQQRPFVGSMRRRFGDEIVDLINCMWSQLPRERPSMLFVCQELERLISMKRKNSAQ